MSVFAGEIIAPRTLLTKLVNERDERQRLTVRRRWAAPHQPRLDWQLWFAALGYATEKPWLMNRLFGSNSSAAFWLANYNVDPWFVSFMVRLLQGSPEVVALLGRNPFPDAPPHYVRAVLYQYHFTDVASRSPSGRWWWRKLEGSYFPAISLGAN